LDTSPTFCHNPPLFVHTGFGPCRAALTATDGSGEQVRAGCAGRANTGRAMRRNGRLGLIVSFALLLAAGCWTTRNSRSSVEPPPPNIRPTRSEYLDPAA